MAENLNVEAPDFDLVRKETGRATEDALRTQWYVLNDETRQRRLTVRRVESRIKGTVLINTASTSINNLDAMDALTVLFTDAAGFNVTGIRNGEEGRLILFHNVGAGTKTFKNASASSDALNRIRTQSGADISVTQDKSLMLQYLNSLWREIKFA